MTRGETALLAGAILSLAAALAMPRAVAPIAPGSSGERPRAAPGVRLTMMELHRQGGVPRGWQPRVPPGDADAGRATFVALGCPSCHRVAGEAFSRSAPSGPGPELSGMGSHHPAAYFAEALLDPDAVVLEGAGWVDDDGRSTMPAYPDLTVRQLGDLVAYLTSLKQDAAAASAHEALSGRGMTIERVTSDSLPDAPASPGGRTYYAQSYDVLPERLLERGGVHHARLGGVARTLLAGRLRLGGPAQLLVTVSVGAAGALGWALERGVGIRHTLERVRCADRDRRGHEGQTRGSAEGANEGTAGGDGGLHGRLLLVAVPDGGRRCDPTPQVGYPASGPHRDSHPP